MKRPCVLIDVEGGVLLHFGKKCSSILLLVWEIERDSSTNEIVAGGVRVCEVLSKVRLQINNEFQIQGLIRVQA
jgi:hypothetical protein